MSITLARLAIIISSIVLFSACTDTNSTITKNNAGSDTTSNYQWQKIADSSAWKTSYNFQMFSIHDTLWVFHSEGCWYSAHGNDWQKSPLPNVINNHAFLDYVFFKEAIYGLGHFEGNIEQYRFKKEIYKTADMKSWERISVSSNLPERFFYHPFVFNNKIWIIGGEDKTTKYADVWNSEDGIHWIKQKDSLPFGKRSNSHIVTLNGKLYLLNNDVWSSKDGVNWQQETAEIVKGSTLFGYTPVVYDNKMWLLGCNRNEQFSSQILSSSDGKKWETHNAPWLPRGGVATAVFKNKIYMTGGKYGGTPAHTEFRYDNDLWTMEKK